MNIDFGCGYEQGDPGWYLVDHDTGLIVACDEVDPTPEQLAEINRHPQLLDIYTLIQKEKRGEEPLKALTPKQTELAIQVLDLSRQIQETKDAAPVSLSDPAWPEIRARQHRLGDALHHYMAQFLDSWK